MTGNNYILDTNIIIELFRGNVEIKSIFNLNDKLHIPFAVLGELYLGAYKSNNIEKHLIQIENFIQNCYILNPDEDTSNQYGLLKSKLLKKGKPIPENDIWIAAISKQYKFQLITLDKHFLEISEIKIYKI